MAISTDLWVAFGATALVAGTGYQTVLAALLGIDSMSGFLGAHNEIAKQAHAEIRATIPRWRYFKLRRTLKAKNAELLSLLNDQERLLSKRYDQQALGWSLVFGGSLLAAIAAWMVVARSGG